MAAHKATFSMGLAFVILALMSVPSVAAAAATAPQWAVPGCQATFRVAAERGPGDQDIDALFSLAPLPDGRREMTVRTGDLDLQKRVAPNGEASLRLQARDDLVVIDISGATVTVTRGRTRVVLSATSPDEASLLAAQQALAGSRAIRRLRTFASELERSPDLGPAVAGVALADALLGYLSGDTGAPARLAARLKARRDARVRQVRYVQDGEMEVGCYRTWEHEVILAWSEYEGCKADFEWWNPIQELCTVRYLLWVESAWFQFLGCSALPFMQ